MSLPHPHRRPKPDTTYLTPPSTVHHGLAPIPRRRGRGRRVAVHTRISHRPHSAVVAPVADVAAPAVGVAAATAGGTLRRRRRRRRRGGVVRVLVGLVLRVFLVVGVLSLLERVFVWVALYERGVSPMLYNYP